MVLALTFLLIKPGIMMAEEYKTANNQSVLLIETQEIEVNENGFVISGYLSENQTFTTEYGYNIPCAEGTKVKFNENGYLILGTLSESKNIVNSAGEEVYCEAGEEVGFDNNGLLNR